MVGSTDGFKVGTIVGMVVVGDCVGSVEGRKLTVGVNDTDGVKVG
jgi:hypothetical protein